ncbi:MAG TPA: hypothetical protein DHV86_01740 [Methylophilaceae bacterium]|jgi:glycosyltransferase involved in cell wall biosynthesis|nr:hypothetical protein [Methylophilaceae bacterium]
MKNCGSQVLYISIDGIMEPLGYSQVLKYLERLSRDHAINLISFEKKDDLKNLVHLNAITKKCNDHNICWYRLKYRSGFCGLGKLVNIINLIFAPIYIFLKKKIHLVHIRSYMPGIVIPVLKALFEFKLIFDMRGFWVDEKHDRLGWSKKSFKYRFFKQLECYLLNTSDHIVTLTNSSKNIIAKRFNITPTSIQVIPTCVDFHEFRRVENLSTNRSLTIGYLGSVDTAYDFPKFCILISQMQSYLDQTIILKVLTSQSHAHVARLIPQQVLSKLLLEVKFVDRAKLSEEISSFDFLGFYLKENFSINASMPTKIAEALACGIPIVCNGFNSDIKDILEKKDIGLIYDFDNRLTEDQLNRIFYLIQGQHTASRCIEIAEEHFSLEKGASLYSNIYSKFIQNLNS